MIYICNFASINIYTIICIYRWNTSVWKQTEGEYIYTKILIYKINIIYKNNNNKNK